VVAVPLRRGPRVVARPGRLDAVQLQRQAKPRADAVSLVRPAERGAVRLERAVGGEDGAALERFTVHRPKLTSPRIAASGTYIRSRGGFFGAFNAITRVVWAELLLM
jgi:hypothetical protein